MARPGAKPVLSSALQSLETPCHRGSHTCLPEIAIVTSPSRSYCAQPLAKGALESTRIPKRLRAVPASILRRRLTSQETRTGDKTPDPALRTTKRKAAAR